MAKQLMQFKRQNDKKKSALIHTINKNFMHLYKNEVNQFTKVGKRRCRPANKTMMGRK